MPEKFRYPILMMTINYLAYNQSNFNEYAFTVNYYNKLATHFFILNFNEPRISNK